MAPFALGADFTATLPCAADLPEPYRQNGKVAAKVRPIILWEGAFNPPAPRVENLSEARGNRTREPRWGDGGAVSRERRGAPVRVALSGRGRRSVRPQRLGRRKVARSHPRRRQKKPHAVKKKNLATHPPGKMKAVTQ